MKILEDIVTETEKKTLENGTIINRFTHVVKGAEIGKDSMIGSFCYVAADTTIGEKVRIQNHNSIFEGCKINDEVFIAPMCAISNYHDPRKRFETDRNYRPDKVIIGKRVTIGINSTIIAPCIIGEGAMIAAGSIVLRSIGSGEMVRGIVKA